jgi:electron transport complex protein RnfG
VKNSYIGQAWLVLALALCFGAALAGVESALKDRITANKLAATVEQIPLLVDGADLDASRAAAAEPLVVTLGEGKLARTYQAYRALAADGRLLGWVIKADGKGFADKIELLIGVSPRATTISGLYILDQKETPGLGNKIREEDFLWAFNSGSLTVGKPLVVVTGASPNIDNCEIKAVAGATISSKSVCDIVNDTLSSEMQAKLAAASAAATTQVGTHGN